MVDVLKTERFGELTFDISEALIFPEGIPGFEDDNRWIIVGDDDSLIKWLQSCTSPEVALPVIPALQVFPGYRISLSLSDSDKLGKSNFSDIGILLVVSVPVGNPGAVSVNLKAPILVDKETRRGYQFVVLNENYTIDTPLMDVFKVTEDIEDSPC